MRISYIFAGFAALFIVLGFALMSGFLMIAGLGAAFLSKITHEGEEEILGSKDSWSEDDIP